jgi:hypothetical protein
MLPMNSNPKVSHIATIVESFWMKMSDNQHWEKTWIKWWCGLHCQCQVFFSFFGKFGNRLTLTTIVIHYPQRSWGKGGLVGILTPNH